MYFFVFGYICFVGKVVKVVGVCFGVEFGDEWCFGFFEYFLVYFGKVGVVLDIFDIGEVFGLGVDVILNCVSFLIFDNVVFMVGGIYVVIKFYVWLFKK